MIKNYFKVAMRHLFRNKEYTAINILGLAIGITACMLIMLFVRSEWSYDKFHTKADRIHRVWLQEIYEGQTFTNTITPLPLGTTMKENMPDIEASCRVTNFNTFVQNGGNRFNESINLVDSNFFEVFDFGIADGNRSHAFLNSNSLVISREIEKKYFGKERALGKNLELQLGDQKFLFTVTAIAKKVPQESSIQFDMLIPHSNEKYLFSERARTRGWTSVFGETYILLKHGIDALATEAKFPALVKKIAGDNYKEGQYNLHLQPIADIHLNKKLPAGNLPTSDPSYSYILATIGFLILLIGCINFVTLSIGRSTTRAMEVGVRKVMGAERPQLIRQFWGEALLVVLFSLAVAIISSYLLLKPFNLIVGRELVFAFDVFTIIFIIGLVLIVGLIAGMYPAIILSAFAPVKVLKGRLQSGAGISFSEKHLLPANSSLRSL